MDGLAGWIKSLQVGNRRVGLFEWRQQKPSLYLSTKHKVQWER